MNLFTKCNIGEDCGVQQEMKGVTVLLISLTAFGALAHGEVFLETDFEGSTSLPSGWTQSQVSGSATWTIQQGGQSGNPSTARSGSKNATLYFGNTSDNITQLISPIFDADGYTNLTMTFWHAQEKWVNDQDELKVLYSSDGGSNWTELAHYTENLPEWTRHTLNIPSGSANSRIAFAGNAKYGYGVCLDDVRVERVPDGGYDLNILMIGSTHSFSNGGEHDVVHEKAFNPGTIATHLRRIISQDPAISDTVNVVFEDVFKTKTNTVRTSSTGIDDITAHCYSLAQHYFWPDGKATRLSNLRGEAGTRWDYILLCGDPYIMANFPGMYAEGVKLIRDEVARSPNPAQVLLLAQWPENSSTFAADDFNEVVHRVGGDAGLSVVPAGKVWDSYTGQDTDTAHPTPKGTYLAAAAIYSKLYDRSASTSVYDFLPGGDAIADHALSEVQAISAAAQYSGTYTDINAFQMKHVTNRVVSFRETGTSTEDRLADALHRLDDVSGITFVQNQGSFWDFNYGRGNDRWEDDKDYEVNPSKYDRSYGFPMHHYYTGSAADAAAQTMPYGIDKYYYGSAYEDGTDLGIAYNMVRPNTRETGLPEGHDVRAIPIRLMWLKMEQAWPGFPPLGDNTHMGPHLNDASAAFMYTLLSGRCPVVEEPANSGSTAWLQWLGHKTGYETAWQMSHLTTRAPGFRVMPSDESTTAVTTVASETMTVQFMNPPEADVTVYISVSNNGVASVSPTTLVFTPSNYGIPQEVTVSGLPITPASEPFEVIFSTSSDDMVYDNLSDAWAYTTLKTGTQTDLIAGFDGNNTSTTAGSTKTLSDPHQSTAALAMGVDATLSTTDPMAKEFQWTAANQASLGTWGTLVLPPPPITFNNTNVATINAPTTLHFTIDNTGGTQSLELQTFHFSALRDAGAALQVTIAYAGGDLAGTSVVRNLVNDTGTNHGYDIDLSTILTDTILAPGETATFTLAQTTSETARLKLDDIAISGEVLSAGPALAVSISPSSISENGGSATATVTRNSDTTGALAVTLVSSDESEATVASGNIPAGQSSADFPVTAVDDGILDGTQTLTITASASGHMDGNATLDVTDDEAPVTYTVTYYGNNQTSGTAPANQIKTAGVDLTLATNSGNLTKTGFTFGGWNTASNGSGNDYATGTTYTDDADLTLYAKWNAQTGTGILTPVSATSTSTIGAPRTLDAAIDGTLLSESGISGDILSETVTYAGSVGHWLSASTSINDTANFRSTTEVLTFTLAAPSNVNAFHLWPYIRSEQVRGLKTCDISFSMDGGNTYPVTIPAATLGQFTIGPTGGTAPVQTLTFTEQTGVTHIRLTNLTTFGSTNYIGISELRFGGTPTPGNNFAGWIGGFEVGGQTGFQDDPDRDGLANGIESWFGTHPGEFTAGMLPDAVDTTAGTFTFTHPLNENPPSDVNAAYRWSKDLINFHYSGQSDSGGTTVTFTPGTPSDGMVTTSALITGTATDRIFVDTEVNRD